MTGPKFHPSNKTKYQLSVGTGAYRTALRLRAVSFHDLLNIARRAKGEAVEPDKLEQKYFCRAEPLGGAATGTRGDEGIEPVAHFLFLDADVSVTEWREDGTPVDTLLHSIPLKRIHEHLEGKGIDHIIHSTWSHQNLGEGDEEKGYKNPQAGPRGRIIIPITYTREELPGLLVYFRAILAEVWVWIDVDGPAKTWSQPAFLPYVREAGAPYEFYFTASNGRCVIEGVPQAAPTVEHKAVELDYTSPAKLAQQTPGHQEHMANKIASALEVDKRFDDRTAWALNGMICEHAERTGEIAPGVGRILWDAWSEQSPKKYSAKAQAKEWKTFGKPPKAGAEQRKPVTVATLFQYAKGKGWSGASKPLAECEQLFKEALSSADLRTVLGHEAMEAFTILDNTDKSISTALRNEFKAAFPGNMGDFRDRVKDEQKDLELKMLDLDSGKQLSHYSIAKALLQETRHDGVEGLVYTEGALWTCQDGLWSRQEKEEVNRMVTRSQFEGTVLCKRASDYKQIAEQLCVEVASREFFTAMKPGIVTGKEYWNIKDGEIVKQPLTASLRQRVQLDHVPVNEPPVKWLAFLEQSFAGHFPEEQIALLQEVLGCIITGKMREMQKATLLYGDTSTGKSVLYNVVWSMFPKVARTTVKPTLWGDPVYVAKLVSKRFNGVEELTNKAEIPVEAFKTITSGEMLSGKKLFKDPEDFVNECGHLFCSNDFPRPDKPDPAFDRRWTLFWLNNQIPEAEKNTQLTNELRTELPQIIYWALEGAARVDRNGTWTHSPVHYELMSLWAGGQSTVMAWFQSGDVVLSGKVPEEHRTRLTQAELYERYTAWCGKHQEAYAVESLFSFTQQLCGSKETPVFPGVKKFKSGETYILGLAWPLKREDLGEFAE